jgi:hypothetical protein
MALRLRLLLRVITAAMLVVIGLNLVGLLGSHATRLDLVVLLGISLVATLGVQIVGRH